MKRYQCLIAWICFLFVSSIVYCEEEVEFKKKLYLSSRLVEEARRWNDKVCQVLTQQFEVFRPQDLKLDGIAQDQIDDVAYRADIEGMRKAEMLLLLPPYGRDCAWEVGWFCGQGKVAVAYVEKEEGWLTDAMIKGGLSAVITSNPFLYDKLLKDPQLRGKSFLISSLKELPNQMLLILE